MPYWFDQEPDVYIDKLNENSMMSIDQDYDPEKDIVIQNFEHISRALDYKPSLIKFLQQNKG